MVISGAVVLRPEPGNARTAALLAAAGVDAVRRPLFAVTPLAWQPPDPAAHDGLLLTSANAVCHAGEGLTRLMGLPVLAVGEATAAAARAAGLTVALVGGRDAHALKDAARTAGFARLLHLAGHDRIDLPGVTALSVYRSDVVSLPPGTARSWEGRVALLHSVRAARRCAEVVDRDGAIRGSIALAALSPAVRLAAGRGWACAVVPDQPADTALVACAVALIDPSRGDVDKRGR